MLAKIQADERAKKNAEDNQYWEMAQRHKTYKVYLSKYPKGLHAKEAENLLHQGNSVSEFIEKAVVIIILATSLITFIVAASFSTFCYLIL